MIGTLRQQEGLFKMVKYRDEALNIRKLMREAEAVSDEAMVAFAKLKAAMLSARQSPEIPVYVGQRAIMRLTQAEQQALSISTNLLRVHDELSNIAREFCGPDTGDQTKVPASALNAEIPVAEAQFS
ncbi:hypothetical protein [Parerythrobacter lacustris]|uniref:Uncharacterized protein n=1 Tax=Parerythrobacter lacustris TaxID=2969984 RepID=A0ABT1XM65_9SPHN|nr:hypothetical protein [Parerythrobacter lacustris]MCR2832748.1 hypothetical protein [Parerythrobacter lacustris]